MPKLCKVLTSLLLHIVIQINHQQTGERCAARGIQYEPMVFTAQGGCESRAESILNQIVQSVADAEGMAKAVIKADLME